MKRIVTLLLCLLLVSGCGEEAKNCTSEEALEMLQTYYEPYYVEESAIVESSDEDDYDPNIEMYNVCKDYDEEYGMAGEILFEVKVNLRTGQAEELGNSGSVMDSYNLKDIDTGDNEEKEELDVEYSEEKEQKENTIASYQGEIQRYEYLDRDNLFLFWLKDGNHVITDLQGKILENADVELKSEYLTVEEGIWDIFGNDVQDRFIHDDSHEKILNVCRMDERDVIWVWESQETALDTKIVIKGFDEKGNELYRINSDDPQIEEANLSGGFKDISYVEYSGDVTCRIVDKNRRDLFSINMETGELLDPRGQFSDGFAVIDFNNYIQDIHGNTVRELPYDTFKATANYREELFFSATSGKFYDIDLNEKIDLSNYDILCWGDEWKEEYCFKDGYCGIEASNENGTRFYGVIDKQGNWIVEMSDTLAFQGDKYRGKVTETKLNLGGRFYDIETQEFTEPPEGFWEQGPELIDGVYYFLNKEEGTFYCYDADRNEISRLDQKEREEGQKQSQTTSENEKIDITSGLGMEWQEFHPGIVKEDFEETVVSEDGNSFDMECEDVGMYCGINEDEIYLLGLYDVVSDYCIGRAYIGQDLQAGENELREQGFAISEEYDSYSLYTKENLCLEVRGDNGKIQCLWLEYQ